MNFKPIVKNIFFIYASISLLLSPLDTQAKELAKGFQFRSFTSKYMVYYRGIPFATLTEEFKMPQANQYSFTTKTEPGFTPNVISITQFSEGYLTGNCPKSKVYHYRKAKSNGKKSERRFAFSWAKKEVTDLVAKSKNRTKNVSWAFPQGTCVQDKLSMELALMQDLNRGKRKLVYMLPRRGGKFVRYRFKVDGTEKIDTKLGKLYTIRLKRMGVKKSSLRLWVAKKLNYAIVQIEQGKAGEKPTHAVIESLTTNNTSIS